MRNLITILLLLAAGPASAQQALAPEAPLPHLCEDLGLWCQGAFGENSPLLQTLTTTDPRNFLPPDLARYANRCELARLQGDTATVAFCHTLRPLGRLRTLVLIPAGRIQSARLPASGARAVSDCAGLHLQVRSDLPAEREFALIKRALTRLEDDNLQNAVLRFGQFGGHDWPGVASAGFCSVGDARPPRHISSIEWRDLGSGYDGTWVVGQDIPRDYVTQACFVAALPRPAAPPAAAAPYNVKPDYVPGNGEIHALSTTNDASGSQYWFKKKIIAEQDEQDRGV